MAINPIVDEFLDYVSARSAANQPPKFEWDEWEPHLYIEPLDDDEIARLDTLTPRALLCLATGITLWTFHRLAPFGLNPLAAELIEVVSASTIDAPAFEYQELDPDDWRGPQNGPFALSLDALIDSVHDPAQIELLGENVFCVLQHARHACEHDSALEVWYNSARTRLERTQQTSKVRPKDYVAGFFDEYDFLGDPLSLSELMLGTDGELTANFTFLEQSQAVSGENPFYALAEPRN